MASCPLYKKLKPNGTSFFCMPGAAEDMSAAHQNVNYKMYFSKYILLDLPKEQSSIGGTQAQNSYFDFSTFSTISTSFAPSYSERVVESLRNYVANHEVSLRESRLNNTEYYYDTRALETTSEKIFWKWCKKLNIINWKPALSSDEYFANLEEFQRADLTDPSYFPEYLWKERESFSFQVVDYYQTSVTGFSGKLELLTSVPFGSIDIRVGDVIHLSGVGGAESISLEDTKIKVLNVYDNSGQCAIIIDFNSTSSSNSLNLITSELVYHKIVKYIGEVNGISNVQEANRSYTEVYAHIPDHTGETPDILFRTIPDINYRPGLEFPIIPSQYQPEIIGAELFSSPIVSDPSNYPGGYYGQYDTIDFIYQCEPGDTLRRSGRFYGVSGDINSLVVDGSSLDGVTVDFNTNHYVKMNITDREVSTFDQFNALEVNYQPPKDFQFNSILWYYTVEDMNGNKRTNLYGISFLDNPENNTIAGESGIRFPSYQKLVTNGSQDGTAYAFGLNLNYNIIHDNPQEAYNPEAINSLFSMNLFNEAMRRLSSVNDSFTNILGEQSDIKSEILNLKQLLYSQTDINIINSKILNLENLLKLYSTQQMVSSDTIQVEVLDSSPSQLRLNNIDTKYSRIDTILTKNMYDPTGSIPIFINPVINKDFMVNIINDDDVNIVLPNNDKLIVKITEDLSYKQTMTFLISGSKECTQNKNLDIFITTVNPIGSTSSTQSNTIQPVPIETLLIGDIDLPVFYNVNTSQPNSASTWNEFNFNIDLNSNIQLLSGNILQMKLTEPDFIVTNSINIGDELVLSNLFIGTTSIFNFSGQYPVDNVSGATISLDVSSNIDFVAYASNTYPLNIHTPPNTLLSNSPYLSINKGYIINVTRVSQEDLVPLSEKYLIDVRNIKY